MQALAGMNVYIAWTTSVYSKELAGDKCILISGSQNTSVEHTWYE